MKWLITGGCGFIGSNVAELLVADGIEPVVFDNLSRPRVEQNRNALVASGIECVIGDIRDAGAVRGLLARHDDIDVVLHLAGQVSFMRSLAEPRNDFETNALGTFNVLEAVRDLVPGAAVFFSSTNKVYGDLADLRVREDDHRFVLEDFPNGVPNTLPMSLHGGYGCSKGAADALVTDWSRFHGITGVVFRQSSIYGGRQFSTEDQGWAAFFAERFVSNSAFSISGTGKQVRDLLHVSDLYRAFRLASEDPKSLAGQAMNIGGGPNNSLSLLELFERLERATGNRPPYEAGPERPADQKVFVADIRPLSDSLGWSPAVGLDQGIEELVSWVRSIGLDP